MLDGDSCVNEVSGRILTCAIEVHRQLGPGLSEGTYEAALGIEMTHAGLAFQRQIKIPVFYKGELISEHRPDFIVEGRVIIELKTVERLTPVHVAQVRTYLRIARLTLGLLLNFNSAVLKDGLKRVILERAGHSR